MHFRSRPPFIFVSLLALLFGACATPPPTPAPRVPPPAPPARAEVEIPVIHEGTNFRYVQRVMINADIEREAPYWLTGFNNVGRERVLPADNQGVALVLQAPVGVPKLLIEEKGANEDRVHMRIINRGEQTLKLEITCLNRTIPYRRHARVDMQVNGNSMIDLALDTPTRDRANLMVRVR